MYLYICSCVLLLLLLLLLSIRDIIIGRHPFYFYLLYDHVPIACTFLFVLLLIYHHIGVINSKK